MIEIEKHTTIGTALLAAADRYADHPLFVVPENPNRDYDPNGLSLSFAQVAQQVLQTAQIYQEQGYGFPHHVALFLENQSAHLIHKLALNHIGACCVPVNPSYKTLELVYLFEHAKPELVVVLDKYLVAVQVAVEQASHKPHIVPLSQFETLPAPKQKTQAHTVQSDTPASILYTSGTTGKPKGCVLSHRYELASGDWYARKGGLIQIHETQDRLYNPLPLFHINSSVLSFFCMMLTGNCQIQSDRFQPSRWWQEVIQTDASIVHYLGVIISLLLKQPESALDRQHRVRFGHGAGVEPQLHALFEERFGFPLIELWGMTEIVRVFTVNEPPRKVGTRAFGRPVPGMEVKIVDTEGNEVAKGEQGEMLVRHSEATPRKDFFSGYFNDPEATEKAWRGGWFHTGDMVYQDEEDGMLHFVDRDKNIIRRSGENIAAAEVEALILTHPAVRQVAVLAAPDPIREAEVLACVELRPEFADQIDAEGAEAAQQLAESIFQHCHQQLAYYKSPGWLYFIDEIPTTGTQKIQKHQIFPNIADPTTQAGMIDLRHLKRRGS